MRKRSGKADLGILAACSAYLPSSDPSADLTAAGRAARPNDLRAVRRRELGRDRPDLLAGGGVAGDEPCLVEIDVLHKAASNRFLQRFRGSMAPQDQKHHKGNGAQDRS